MKLSSTSRPLYTARDLDATIENATTDWWYRNAALVIRQLAARGRAFDIDDIYALVGEPQEPAYAGAALAAAQRSKLIEPVGCRIGRHGRLLRRWWPVPR